MDKMVGHIDGVHDDAIHGWIFPVEPVVVKNENHILNTLVPDYPRMDVVNTLKIHETNLGFYYPLTWEILHFNSISFMFKKNEEWLHLPNSPFDLRPSKSHANRLQNLIDAPPFALDSISYSADNSLIVKGYLIPYVRGQKLALQLKADGELVENIEWSAVPANVMNYFWFLPIQENYFTITFKNLKNVSAIRLQPFLSGSNQALSQFYFIDIPLKAFPKNIPENYRQIRVSGWADALKFWSTGFNHMRVIKELIECYHPKKLSSIDYLDWGCGCGRIIRHFLESDLRPGRVVEVDIDKSNVEWCKANLIGGEFYTTELYPPLPFADNTLDIVSANSVFTHLNQENQEKWLIELNRILKPNGIAILTVHHNSALAYGKAGVELINKWEAEQFIGLPNENLKEILEDNSYYQNTFQTKEYTYSQWNRFMEIIAIHEMIFGFQDAVILRKM